MFGAACASSSTLQFL